MTKTDLNKQKTEVWTEKIEWTTHQKEMVEEFNKTPLTQQVAQLRGEVQNLNKWMFELLGLFKEVLKKQTNTETMIENLEPKITQNSSDIAKISQQVDNITPSRNEIINDIFSGKNAGELQILGDDYVSKANISENIEHSGATYRPEDNDYLTYYQDTSKIKNIMLYCINVILALRNKGIKIENRGKIDIWWNEVFCKAQWFSWTTEEIKKTIKNYCGTDFYPKDILKYILYLYKKYYIQ